MEFAGYNDGVMGFCIGGKVLPVCPIGICGCPEDGNGRFCYGVIGAAGGNGIETYGAIDELGKGIGAEACLASGADTGVDYAVTKGF